MPLHETTNIYTEEHGIISLAEVAGTTVHVPFSSSPEERYRHIIRWQEAKIELDPRPLACHQITVEDPEGIRHTIIAGDGQVFWALEDPSFKWMPYTAKELKLGSLMPGAHPTDNDHIKNFTIISITRMWHTHQCYKLWTADYNTYILANNLSIFCDGVWNR